MPWTGTTVFDVLNVFPGAPLANWAFTCLCIFGICAIFIKIILRVIREGGKV